MLVVDIETLGLLHTRPLPAITCVCLYDTETEERHSLLFHKEEEEEFLASKELLLGLLDGASHILGYNAMCFDLEYICRFFEVDPDRGNGWFLKCVDPYMALKCLTGQTARLQVLLTLNNLGSKTGCGANAIHLAESGQWDELLAYCMEDVLLTHRLCELEWILLPDGARMGLRLGAGGGVRWEVERRPAPVRWEEALCPCPLATLPSEEAAYADSF